MHKRRMHRVSLHLVFFVVALAPLGSSCTHTSCTRVATAEAPVIDQHSTPAPAAVPATSEAVPQPSAETSDDSPPPSAVTGTCGALLAGVKTDLNDADAAELVELVTGWMRSQDRPRIDARLGVLFAKSEDDLGGEPPYPSFVRESATRACGLSALWLVDHVAQDFRLHGNPQDSGIRCDENVCCFPAMMEYDSSGTATFRKTSDGAWVIESYVEMADNGTIGLEHVQQAQARVRAAAARASRQRCAGEPAVAW